ncbi:sigma-70 family RNA polymerase sigma factor [Paenibacillus larvae]|uniref:RNA polymerase sigma-B factor SigB n=3 Tax=Paenibacillus larvae TaxID=1464 RepID=A0A2L1U2D8_9BACL|nr:sigma-70 family RNA polymerase sigma factor [Paenibacillus larvae]AVF27107.1 RNA polymerase sigma-B factor SigB [Paenibacillus larvae subsp. larvae]
MSIRYNPHLGNEGEVIQAYEKMVHSVARKYRSFIGAGLDYDDLVSVGMIGLIQAFRNYDPDRFNGKVTSFSTYAMPMIRGNMNNFLKSKHYLVRVPRSIQDKLNIIRKNGWDQESAESIAEKTGWKLSEIREVQRHLAGWSVASLDQAMSSPDKPDEEATMLDVLPVMTDFTSAYVQDFLSALKPEERAVVELRMQDQAQREIAESLGKSQGCVSRILKKIGEKYNQFQAGNLKREAVKMSRGQGNQTALNTSIEWFVDEVVPTNPTIGLNSQGMHFNQRAVQQIGCNAGQCVQIGYDAGGPRLIIQVGDNGLKLRAQKGDRNGTLRIINKRLPDWLRQKKVTRKRYALQADTESGFYYIELDRHA